MFDLTISAAFIAGVLSFFSPCVLPLVPGYMGYLGSLSQAQHHHNSTATPSAGRYALIMRSVIFVCGFVTVFMLLGLSSSYFGGVIASYLDYLQIIAGLVIIILGVHFTGLISLGFLNREMRVHQLPKSADFGGTYITGMAFGFGWTPCVGPVLATILLLVASQPENMSGLWMLTSYGLGLGLPFVFVAAFYEQFIARFRIFTKSTGQIKWVLGGILIATGLVMVFGFMDELGFWLLRSTSLFQQIG